MRDSSHRLTIEHEGIASFRRRRTLAGWAAVAILLLFGIIVSLTYPGSLDVVSDEAAIARIDPAAVEDTARGHLGPPETSGKLVERRATTAPLR